MKYIQQHIKIFNQIAKYVWLCVWIDDLIPPSNQTYFGSYLLSNMCRGRRLHLARGGQSMVMWHDWMSSCHIPSLDIAFIINCLSHTIQISWKQFNIQWLCSELTQMWFLVSDLCVTYFNGNIDHDQGFYSTMCHKFYGP